MRYQVIHTDTAKHVRTFFSQERANAMVRSLKRMGVAAHVRTKPRLW